MREILPSKSQKPFQNFVLLRGKHSALIPLLQDIRNIRKNLSQLLRESFFLTFQIEGIKEESTLMLRNFYKVLFGDIIFFL
jgi:hypothetical protein